MNHRTVWSDGGRAALRNLPHPVQTKLLDLHERMVRSFARQLVTGSMVLPLIFSPWLIVRLLRVHWRRVFSAGRKRYDVRIVLDRAAIKIAGRANARAFEADAYFSEREARAYSEELQAV
jgi:hypothetical protein